MALDRTLFEISVKESDKSREYWLDRPWLEARRDEVRSTDVLIVPWEDFREGSPALFPQGAADTVRQLAQFGNLTLGIAVDGDSYQEILMHSKMHRLPTMLVKVALLPALAGMLGNLMSDFIIGGENGDKVELKLIVQGEHGKCISLDYSGPPNRLVETIVAETERCLPVSSNASEPSVKKASP